MPEPNKNIIILTRDQLSLILATTIANAISIPKEEIHKMVETISPACDKSAQNLIDLYKRGGLEE